MDEREGRMLRLASNNPRPRKPACTTCVHYHPNLIDFGMQVVTWHWIWPFRRVVKIASASSHRFAVCSYFGGCHASHARHTCEGHHWELKDDAAAPLPSSKQSRKP
jgi:hypothetical protein